MTERNGTVAVITAAGRGIGREIDETASLITGLGGAGSTCLLDDCCAVSKIDFPSTYWKRLNENFRSSLKCERMHATA
jgi:hypothetical protein